MGKQKKRLNYENKPHTYIVNENSKSK